MPDYLEPVEVADRQAHAIHGLCVRVMRCAIYTRKSADEAANSQHSSIETQRDLCMRYIESQAGEGWVPLAERYDDLGASGGNIVRPALGRLLADVRAGAIDTIVVYKIDRLSRSLRDFLNLIDVFEKAGVTFISTTQSFSTTTSMGRLTLNVLLSFAQFEREMIGERRRDWVAGARAKGLWTSGPAPFGYIADNLHLVIHPERANVVRYAFRRLRRTRSYGAIADELNDAGHVNRFGRPFDGRTIKTMLSNRIYRGDTVYKGDIIPSTHEAIVTEVAWRRAKVTMSEISKGHYGRSDAWQRGRRPAGLR